MDRLDSAAVFAETILGVQPHAAQIRYLLDRHQTKVLVGGRRSGKTMAIAIEVAFHAALGIRKRRPLRQLLVAPAVDQARLLFSAVLGLLRDSSLGGIVTSDKTSPFPELNLFHGGLVYVRAAHDRGRALRGHSAERVIVDEALRAAIGLFKNNTNRHPIRTFFRDETTGALDPDNAVRYVAMLRRLIDLGGIHHLLFITHNPDAATLADTEIVVKDGQPTIVRQGGIRAAA